MNTSARHLSAVALACLALALCTQFAKAQTSPSAPGGAVKILVNANAVLVPVVVRDLQGRAVGDLKKEDFQIFDKNIKFVLLDHPRSTRTRRSNQV
jgi:hypothetical protein